MTPISLGLWHNTFLILTPQKIILFPCRLLPFYKQKGPLLNYGEHKSQDAHICYYSNRGLLLTSYCEIIRKAWGVEKNGKNLREIYLRSTAGRERHHTLPCQTYMRVILCWQCFRYRSWKHNSHYPGSFSILHIFQSGLYHIFCSSYLPI